MINQKDIKALKQYETLHGKIANWIFICAPILFFVVGILNLKLASIIGNKNGYTLNILFHDWIQGVDVNKQYSGIYLKAMERLTTALLQFGGAIILTAALYTNQILKKRNKRILDTLRHNGLIND
jgi:hypothetical protein